MTKIQKINKVIEDNKLDAIISFSEQTRLWLNEIHTSFGYLFVEKNSIDLFVDGRYIEMATKEAKNANVILIKGNDLNQYIASKKYQRIGIENEYLVNSERETLLRWFPNAELISFSAVKLRINKDENEVAKIKKACEIALKSLEEIKPLIKAGISEKEIDAELEKRIRMNGGEKGSFDAIVASGERSSLPHGRASDKIIKDGEFVTIDFGAYYKGYASDITRTFHVGEVTNPKLLEIEKILREAQIRGVAAVKPGVTTGMIDKICRDYITEKGYGEYFTHSTGHGLGIDVHELPNVSSNPKFDWTLEEGMVITVEPGIYIEGLGGIRVEDDVLVTKDGHKVLSTID